MKHDKEPESVNERLTPEERSLLRHLVEECGGEAVITKQFNVSTEALLRALADRPMRNGTVVLIREALKRVRATMRDGK